MKNNKGFAITATIYGFLVLFLIILLSVLSVTKSQNNRSITISEKIEDKIFPNNEVVIELQKENDFSMVTKRGKYYANVFCGTNTTPNEYFFYAGNNFNKDNIVLYKKNGERVSTTDCNSINGIVVTNYYTSDN